MCFGRALVHQLNQCGSTLKCYFAFVIHLRLKTIEPVNVQNLSRWVRFSAEADITDGEEVKRR